MWMCYCGALAQLSDSVSISYSFVIKRIYKMYSTQPPDQEDVSFLINWNWAGWSAAKHVAGQRHSECHIRSCAIPVSSLSLSLNNFVFFPSTDSLLLPTLRGLRSTSSHCQKTANSTASNLHVSPWPVGLVEEAVSQFQEVWGKSFRSLSGV